MSVLEPVALYILVVWLAVLIAAGAAEISVGAERGHRESLRALQHARESEAT